MLGHNLVFGSALSVALAAYCFHRVQCFWLFLGLFHLHLLLDYYGSGPGWGIVYFWPFSSFIFESAYAWEFFSWQNLCAAGLLLLWTIAIIFKSGRTPLELMMPSLDQKIVRGFRAL